MEYVACGIRAGRPRRRGRGAVYTIRWQLDLRTVRYKDRNASKSEVAIAVKPVFVRSVKGIRPTPYLEQAYTENSERTVALFGDELAVAVEKFVNKNFKPVSK